MKWHRPLSDYTPFSLRWIYCCKAMLAALVLFIPILFFNLPSASVLICAAPFFLMAPDRSLIRDVYWQVPLGFCSGLFFGVLAVNLIGVYWPIAIGLMSLWNIVWVYLSETAPALRIPCRMISIVPLGILSMAGAGSQALIPQMMGLLIGLSFLGMGSFILIDHLFFPIKNNFPPRPPLLKNIKNYFQTFPLDFSHLFLALRTNLSVLIILWISYTTGLPGLSTMVSAIVSAVVVSTPLSDKLKSSLSSRISGTLFGAFLGIVCVFILTLFPFAWLMIFCFIFGTGLITYLAQENMGFASRGMQAGVAFLMTFLPSAHFTVDISGGLDRLLGIIYGCLVAYLVSKTIRLPEKK